MTIQRCTQPFAYHDANGNPVVVGLGDLVSSTDEVFSRRPLLFEPVMVEEATAEPGKLRSLTMSRAPHKAATKSEPAPEPAPKPTPQPAVHEEK